MNPVDSCIALHALLALHDVNVVADFAVAAKPSAVSALAAACRDQSLPIGARMRSVFYLRTMATDDAALALAQALRVKGDSVLLRHEIGFCLGQMGRRVVVPDLVAVLEDAADDVIVRHEAGEALGAIGDASCLPALQRCATDAPVEVRETCAIALDRFRLAGDVQGDSEFDTKDPAPAAPVSMTVDALEQLLMDASASLYDRYRAMFALRNRGDEDAVLALTRGFADASALFRHEVAYVLGQLAHPASSEALARVLADTSEHEMVRHEAAESLGAIGDEAALRLLAKFQHGAPRIVTESCDVALDAAEYWAEFAG